MSNQRACEVKRYEITHNDLPLSCPLPNYRLWDAHPRVYLPIKATGQAVCPYCGSEYILVDFVPGEEDGETT
jgi:uncharacterized Zn-finger protein